MFKNLFYVSTAVLFSVGTSTFTVQASSVYDEDLDRAIAMSLAEVDMAKSAYDMDSPLLQLVPDSMSVQVLGLLEKQSLKQRAKYSEAMIVLIKLFPAHSADHLLSCILNSDQDIPLPMLERVLHMVGECQAAGQVISNIEDIFGHGIENPLSLSQEGFSNIPKDVFMPKPQQDHRIAVGQIFAGNSCGTATRINEDTLISAAHVFENVFPAKGAVTQKSGPYVVDLRNKKVFWQYQLVPNGEPFEVKVSHMVFEAEYFQSRALGSKEITSGDSARDIVFLKINPKDMPPNVPVLPLISKLDLLPQMCAAFGYGYSKDPAKQRVQDRGEFVHQFAWAPQTKKWNSLYLTYKQYDADLYSDETRREVQSLLFRPRIDPQDSFLSQVNQALAGDSGGSLCVVTLNGVRVIGVTSNYDEGNGVNGFASLLHGTAENGYALNQNVVLMLMALKNIRL